MIRELATQEIILEEIMMDEDDQQDLSPGSARLEELEMIVKNDARGRRGKTCSGPRNARNGAEGNHDTERFKPYRDPTLMDEILHFIVVEYKTLCFKACFFCQAFPMF